MATETPTPATPQSLDQQTRPIRVAVDPARLKHGQWCPWREQHVDEGDIIASYSADRIGMNEVIRQPFRWRGHLWLNVGEMHWGGQSQITAYQLDPAEVFDGVIVSYAEKTVDCEAAWSDPMGFYHGIHVTHRAKVWVLCGPPVIFVPGKPQQPGLFGEDGDAGKEE